MLGEAQSSSGADQAEAVITRMTVFNYAGPAWFEVQSEERTAPVSIWLISSLRGRVLFPSRGSHSKQNSRDIYPVRVGGWVYKCAQYISLTLLDTRVLKSNKDGCDSP